MTDAQTVAWNIYIARVQSVLDEQYASFADGVPVCRLTMCPPTQAHVETAQTAIDRAEKGARVAAIKESLSPMVAALDAIDNSGNKSVVVKECRAGIQKGYDRLHALLKSTESDDARLTDLETGTA